MKETSSQFAGRLSECFDGLVGWQVAGKLPSTPVLPVCYTQGAGAVPCPCEAHTCSKALTRGRQLHFTFPVLIPAHLPPSIPILVPVLLRVSIHLPRASLFQSLSLCPDPASLSHVTLLRLPPQLSPGLQAIVFPHLKVCFLHKTSILPVSGYPGCGALLFILQEHTVASHSHTAGEMLNQENVRWS